MFDADTPTAMCVEHATAEPPRLSALTEQRIPADLEELLLQCLRKKPAERPATADELWRELGEIALAAPWTPERAEAWWREHEPERAGG